MPVAFNPGEGRGACFFDTSSSGYFDRWYMLGTVASSDMGGIQIPYSVAPAGPVTTSPLHAVDVDWNKRQAGQGSNSATEEAIRLRDSATVCEPSTPLNDFCTAERKEAVVQAKQVAIIRGKQAAGTKLTSTDKALLAKADAEAAAAVATARAVQAQEALRAAEAVTQAYEAQMAYQRRAAECRAAANLVALSVKSFWGGIAAGVATNAACMP